MSCDAQGVRAPAKIARLSRSIGYDLAPGCRRIPRRSTQPLDIYTAVVVVADVILDACATALITLDVGDLSARSGRVQAMPAIFGECQLCAGMRAFPAKITREPFGPCAEVEALADLAGWP